MYANVHIAANVLAATAVITSQPTVTGAALAAGIIVGSRLPDHAEQRIYPTDDDGNLIKNADGYIMTQDNWCPHRTDTHWVPTWLIGMALAWMIPGAFGTILVGACAGALIHIALDALTPLGVPTILPQRGPRLAIPLFKGASGQEAIAMVLLASAAFLLAVSFKQDKAGIAGALWELVTLPLTVSDQVLNLLKAVLG